MSSIVISGDTSGAITLEAPAVAGTTTISLPAITGSFVTANSSGNVGIGTSSPAYKLDVNGATQITSASGTNLRLFTASGAPLIQFYPDGAGGRVATLYATDNSSGLGGGLFVIEDPSSSNRLVFAGSSGNVGIGTSSPSYKLDVNGFSRFTNGFYLNEATAGLNAAFYLNSNQTLELEAFGANGAIAFSTGSSNTERMRLDSSGNLGLGVTPSAWASGYRSLDMRTNGAGFAASDDAAIVSVNAYNNGGYKFKGTSIYRSSRYDQFDGTHAWHIGNTGTAGNAISFTQAMTLDASGGLQLGVTASDAKLYVTNGASPSSRLIVGGGGGAANTLYTILSGGNNIQFETNGSERARIDSSGNLLVGRTTSEAGEKFSSYISTADLWVGTFRHDRSAGQKFINFSYAGVEIGKITGNGSNTTYSTSSDYRLKDKQQPLTNSGAFIDALKPKTWEWKVDGSKGVGFIAHEVAEVSPSSVVGEKDAVDAEGKPIMQAMEYGSAEFIANIVAELQSLRARIAALESK